MIVIGNDGLRVAVLSTDDLQTLISGGSLDGGGVHVAWTPDQQWLLWRLASSQAENGDEGMTGNSVADMIQQSHGRAETCDVRKHRRSRTPGFGSN